MLRSAVPALVLSALVLLPYLGKPFTIDDTIFLNEARHAIHDPAHPTAFDLTWAEYPERVSQLVPSGPIQAWLLLPSVLAGGREWVAHAIALAMLWVGILATVSLARRLGLGSRGMATAGLLVAASPAVLGMAGTAMPDVPAMALGAAGIERLVAWRHDRRWGRAASATLLLALAPLTRPHLVLLLGVGAVLLLADRPGAGSWSDRLERFLPVLGAPLIALAVLLVTRDPAPHAGNVAAAAATYSSGSLERLTRNLVAFPVHWMLTMTFGLPWLALRWREVARSPWALGAGAVGAGAVGIALVIAGRSPWLLAPLAGLGTAALADAFLEARARRSLDELALASWLLLGLAALPYVHLPSKYLVASAPAAAVLVALAASRLSGAATRLIVGATLVLGASLGLAIVRADAEFAGLGRRAVEALISPRVSAGRQVWFVGHWGFQWYAENAGARHVTLTPPYPAPGDVVVVSAASGRSDQVLGMLARTYPSSVVVERMSDATPGGRIMNKRLGVGFFSNVSGYLPWTWSSSVIDEFTVWEVWP